MTASKLQLDLWFAIEANDLEKVAQIVAKGVVSFSWKADQSHPQDDSTYTSNLLTYSVQKKRFDLLEILYANGHDLSPQPEGSYIGQHNFTYAAQHGHLDLLNWFYERGVPVDARNEHTGCNIMHIAAHFDQLDVIQWAIDRGLDINIQAINKHTPLLAAVKFGSYEGAELLLRLGADPNILSMKDLCPLDEAINHRGRDMVELLIAYDAKFTVDPETIADPNIQEVIRSYAIKQKMMAESDWLLTNPDNAPSLAIRRAGNRL